MKSATIFFIKFSVFRAVFSIFLNASAGSRRFQYGTGAELHDGVAGATESGRLAENLVGTYAPRR